MHERTINTRNLVIGSSPVEELHSQVDLGIYKHYSGSFATTVNDNITKAR